MEDDAQHDEATPHAEPDLSTPTGRDDRAGPVATNDGTGVSTRNDETAHDDPAEDSAVPGARPPENARDVILQPRGDDAAS